MANRVDGAQRSTWMEELLRSGGPSPVWFILLSLPLMIDLLRAHSSSDLSDFEQQMIGLPTLAGGRWAEWPLMAEKLGQEYNGLVGAGE